MGLIKLAYKTAKITAVAAVLYTGSMYIADKYAQSYTEGKKYPVAATIEKIGEDIGDMVKQGGRCAAGLTESGIEKVAELDKWYIKIFFDPHYEPEESAKK